MEFDLKIINRVSIFQDFHELFMKLGQSFMVSAAPPIPKLDACLIFAHFFFLGGGGGIRVGALIRIGALIRTGTVFI